MILDQSQRRFSYVHLCKNTKSAYLQSGKSMDSGKIHIVWITFPYGFLMAFQCNSFYDSSLQEKKMEYLYSSVNVKAWFFILVVIIGDDVFWLM